MHIRITIEDVDGDKVEILHLNMQKVEHTPERSYRQSRNKAVRFMLSEVAECFMERETHADG